MSERCVLILTQQYLEARQIRSGSAAPAQRFSIDEAGHSEFGHWLESHRDALFHLLVDLPDEGFIQESLPHVTGKDRQALLTRKRNQHFHGTPYTLVRSTGRDKQGRRDESFLFAALTRPQAVDFWLEVMHEAGAAIAGIHSPALMLGDLLSREAATEPRLILMTIGAGGLRQCYFEQGQLRFSRLKPLVTDTIEEAAVSTYGEAVRIYQFLIGQRAISRGQKIPVLCLTSPAHTPLLRQACVDTDELSFNFGSLQEAAQSKHISLPANEVKTDTLLSQQLIRQHSRQQFGDNVVRRNYLRRQWRSAIHAATLSILATAGLGIFAAVVAIWLSNQRTSDANMAAAQAQQQYETLVHSLPTIPVSPEQLRSLIGEWQKLQQHSPTLSATLAPVSNALQQAPQLELVSLDWHLASNPEDSSSNAGPSDWLVIDIEARLPVSMSSSRRAQNEAIEQFVSALKLSPTDQARVLQRPFDTDSGKALKGSNEAYAGRESLNFTIRYWRKLETT